MSCGVTSVYSISQTDWKGDKYAGDRYSDLELGE